ncbi:trypsin-like peptidase domain-containing protein [Leptospira sp. 201903071]|uniref:S1C family serine protease n=1 Tax=Leptospira ainazelensis TaxID=2810034 RepID=UPI00196295C7|nr:S1C family serine protease [Leptospira ainazelensis]MBM9499963.1 trypsin-like peptidase domain-containing protein [Leptospira ainazelensis]
MKHSILLLIVIFTFAQCSKDSFDTESLNEESLNVSLHLQNRLNGLISKTLPATVSVFPKGSASGSSPIGSGFFIDSEGHVLTCLHVIKGGSEFLVRPAKSGKLLKAKLIRSGKEMEVTLSNSP